MIPSMAAAVRRIAAAVAVPGALLSCAAIACAADQPHAAQNSVVESMLSNALGSAQIFTLLFLTLGPFKVLAPFAKVTHGADGATRTRIAVTAFVLSAAALFAGMFVGVRILSKWQVSLPALIITAGALLFVVAFRSLIHLYDPNEASAATDQKPTLKTAISPITFPAIATPYGIAILVLLKLPCPIKRRRSSRICPSYSCWTFSRCSSLEKFCAMPVFFWPSSETC